MIDEKIKAIIKIQKLIRGYLYRLKRLPLILYIIQYYLQSCSFECSYKNNDGRINSNIDEKIIINLLLKKFSKKIIVAKKRMWYDILVFDSINGWLPVNIKTTTTLTCDNTGNLSMCLYSYTDEILDLNKNYNNGISSNIISKKLEKKEYNKNPKKDYYFIVINKNNTNDIIVNSIKGLNVLTPNINNLPFQICWKKNRTFTYKHINERVKNFIECIKKTKKSWRENFLIEMKKL